MKYVLSSIFLGYSFFAFCQTGTISGNVFYKYNDFVGNRADAGATVNVLNYDNPEIRLEPLTADVQGNYKTEPLKPGRYMVIVRSKANTADPYKSFKDLQYHSDFLSKLCTCLSDSAKYAAKEKYRNSL